MCQCSDMTPLKILCSCELCQWALASIFLEHSKWLNIKLLASLIFVCECFENSISSTSESLARTSFPLSSMVSMCDKFDVSNVMLSSCSNVCKVWCFKYLQTWCYRTVSMCVKFDITNVMLWICYEVMLWICFNAWYYQNDVLEHCTISGIYIKLKFPKGFHVIRVLKYNFLGIFGNVRNIQLPHLIFNFFFKKQWNR